MRYLKLILVAGFLFLSCSKEEIQEEERIIADEFFYAKVNDKNFITSRPKVLRSDLIFSSAAQAHSLKVHSINDSDQTIEFSVTDYTGPGLYYTGIDINKSYCAYYVSDKAWISGEFEGRKGMITISEETDSSIAGTFYFRGIDLNNPVDIKDIRGEFKVYPIKKNH